MGFSAAFHRFPHTGALFSGSGGKEADFATFEAPLAAAARPRALAAAPGGRGFCRLLRQRLLEILAVVCAVFGFCGWVKAWLFGCLWNVLAVFLPWFSHSVFS